MNAIIIGLIAIFLEGIFAGSEIAITRANWIRLTTWSKKRPTVSVLHFRVDKALKLLEYKEQVLVIILILTNFFVVIASVTFTRFFIVHFGPAYTTIAVILVVLLSLVFSEFLPKIVAQAFPEYWLIIVEPIIRLFITIFSPFLPKSKNAQYRKLSRHDFLYLLKEKKTDESVVINQMAKALFEFSQITVAEIMVPKEHIIGFSEDADFRIVKRIIERYRFSRYPVYQKNTNKIIAVSHIKDILLSINTKPAHITRFLRKPYLVSDNEKVPVVLKKMSKLGEHMGIVCNDKSETIGIITLEDLIEELIGEIRSET